MNLVMWSDSGMNKADRIGIIILQLIMAMFTVVSIFNLAHHEYCCVYFEQNAGTLMIFSFI